MGFLNGLCEFDQFSILVIGPTRAQIIKRNGVQIRGMTEGQGNWSTIILACAARYTN
uniref:Uncharacterized protein n=1 Tax=Banana bunchy top virus TaxID=12585 RepID=Q9YRB6_BBTV|nr:unknown [Banana bunchy top virus]